MSLKNPGFSFNHIMLRVFNQERALTFYRDILGMEITRQRDYESGRFTNTFLAFPGESIAVELTYNWDREEPYPKGENFGHLAMMVDDVKEACSYLESKGVRIKTPPKVMNHGTRMLAFVYDFEENLVELVEPLKDHE
ncbi:lactoylglutathione lyase [Oligella ureolytica]|nr:VOC family protein [Oligella sp.]